MLGKYILPLLPTFLQYLITGHQEPRRPRKIHKTTFLDGLRGVAALSVVILHFKGAADHFYYKPFSLGPFAQDEDPNDYESLLQLPIIRLLYSPNSALALFFLISGYVLSMRAVKIIRSGQDDLGDLLFSSIFRRGFRLFLPPMAGIVIEELSHLVGFTWPSHKHTSPGFSGAFDHFYTRSTHLLTALFHPDVSDDILHHFWTIPVEFLGSMIVFVLILGVSKLSTAMRLSIILGIMIAVNRNPENHFPTFCFLGGYLLAEVEEAVTGGEQKPKISIESVPMLQQYDIESNQTEKDQVMNFVTWTKAALGISVARATFISSIIYDVFWYTLFIFSLLILGWPLAKLEHDPILYPLQAAVPWVDWPVMGSIFFISCLLRLPEMQKLFTNRFTLYLGDISFSMYILHFYIARCLEEPIRLHADGFFGVDRVGHINRAVGNMYELTIYLAIVFWQSDLFLKFVDLPVVRFARGLEDKLRVAKRSERIIRQS